VRLTINGEKVSYSLENERSLGEVVAGVQAWLAATGFLVTDLRADSRPLDLGRASTWGAAEIGSVGELAVQATHTGDMKIEHWQTVAEWLRMLEEALAAPPAGAAAGATLTELLAGLGQTLEGFAANPFLPPGSNALARFRETFVGQDRAASEWPVERRAQAAARVRELREAVARRLSDAARPGEALVRLATVIRGSLGRLREVSVLLQTGRDRQAMEVVVTFADSIQSLMDLLPFLPPDPERAHLLTELTPTLRELVDAFGAKDSILIGDLLEYEVAPRLERIAPLLERAQ
jgi:hypothetical protein